MNTESILFGAVTAWRFFGPEWQTPSAICQAPERCCRGRARLKRSDEWDRVRGVSEFRAALCGS
jgi:hypothetical protein